MRFYARQHIRTQTEGESEGTQQLSNSQHMSFVYKITIMTMVKSLALYARVGLLLFFYLFVVCVVVYESTKDMSTKTCNAIFSCFLRFDFMKLQNTKKKKRRKII